MKKLLSLFLVLTLTVVLAACGNGSGDKDKKIVVGASPAPHAEILEKAKPLLKKKGYDLEIKTINDYTTPNKLLDKGELDANYFQHVPYLKTESKEKDLPKGATVYVSNNPAEQGRFLKFFVDEGLIKIKKGVKIENAKFEDITENKKDIKFNSKQSAEYLPKIYQNEDVDAAIINSNYAIDQGLSPQKDSIAVEKPNNNPYANLIAVQKGHKDDKKIKALIEVLQSKEIQDFIKDKYKGAVVPAK